ncbi:MAG: DUF2786 domain-containing protein [Rhodospirillaceae bacterium]|nr:DUF2786 domain-containing protein [Rhodospirillales bacterium]
MDVQKLAKVLALAASDNETEAVHALRMARRMLDAHGLDFVELSRRVAEGSPTLGNEALEDAVFDLRNEVRHLRCENERLKQGRAPVAVAEPASFQEAARDAAAAIRLRAELAALTDALELERAETLRLKMVEAALQDALATANKLAARVTEVEARRLRVEAENRRMLHASHALNVELAEMRATTPPHDDGRKRAAPRAKAKPGANQYALL